MKYILGIFGIIVVTASVYLIKGYKAAQPVLTSLGLEISQDEETLAVLESIYSTKSASTTQNNLFAEINTLKANGTDPSTLADLRSISAEGPSVDTSETGVASQIVYYKATIPALQKQQTGTLESII